MQYPNITQKNNINISIVVWISGNKIKTDPNVNPIIKYIVWI